MFSDCNALCYEANQVTLRRIVHQKEYQTTRRTRYCNKRLMNQSAHLATIVMCQRVRHYGISINIVGFLSTIAQCILILKIDRTQHIEISITTWHFHFYVSNNTSSIIRPTLYQVKRNAHYLLNCFKFKFYLWLSNLQKGW